MKKLPLLLLAFAPLLFADPAGAQGNYGSGPIPNVITTTPITIGHVIINDGGINYVDGGEPSGTGNVTGPATSVINNFATFSDLTGENIKDSGLSTGTSGAKIPLLNGTNTWSSQQSNSSSWNVTGSGSYQIQGNLFVNITNGNNANQNLPFSDTTLGLGAGINLPTTDTLTTALGFHALNAATNSGTQFTESTAVGAGALEFANGSTGIFNTAVGLHALYQCTTCNHNIAIGTDAMKLTGNIGNDIAIGISALLYDNGGNNLAIGNSVLLGSNTTTTFTGQNNIGIGDSTLTGNNITTAHDNVAVGNGAMAGNSGNNLTTASENVSIGSSAGSGITTGNDSVFIGDAAGNGATTGSANNCIGFQACNGSLTGGGNDVLGRQAGLVMTTAIGNTIVGDSGGKLITTGSRNVLIGNSAALGVLTTGSNNGILCIGSNACNPAASGTSDTFEIQGNTTTPWFLTTGTNASATSVATLAGSLVVSGAASVQVAALTASLPVCTDGSKNLSSTCPAGNQPILIGTTGSIGGGVLLAGACTSGTVAITSSTTAMSVVATPVTYPGDGVTWNGYVSTAGTVTVKVCAIVGLTPTASTYNVRVIQ